MEINGYKRTTIQTFERYYNDDSQEAFEKLHKITSEDAIVPWKQAIDVLRNERKNKEQYVQLLLNLAGNRAFRLSATYCEKRELNDILTDGSYSKERDTKAQKKYLKGNDVLYRHDFERVPTDDDGRYYLNKKTNERITCPSFSTYKSAILKFDPAVWINSLKKKNPDWTDEEIQAFMIKQRDFGGHRGTLMHEMIEDYLDDRFNFTLDKFKESHADGILYFKKMFPFLKYNVGDVIAIEPYLYWDGNGIWDNPDGTRSIMGYADLIATDGESVIMYDWKTSYKRKPKKYQEGYKMQVAIYSLMAKQTLGIEIDKCVIAISPEAGNLQIVELSRNEMEYWLKKFVKGMVQYWKDYDKFMEAG